MANHKIVLCLIALLNLSIVFNISIPFSYSNHNQEESSSFQSFISVNMERDEDNIPNIQISLGSSGEKIGLYISTTDNKLYLANFNYRESRSYITDEVLTPLDPIKPGLKGIFAADDLVINSITVNQFAFVHILDLDINYYYKGRLGLGYNFPKLSNNNEDVHYSFLYQLKKRGIIDQYIVSISYQQPDRHLYLGEYPPNFPQRITQFNYKTCPLIEKGSYGGPNRLWQCNMNTIFFDDYSLYKANKPIAFSLGGNTMNVAKDFFELLLNKYFKIALERKECLIDNTGYSIQCTNIDNVNIRELSFIFGKWSLKMTKEQLFPRKNNNYDFIIRHHEANFPAEWTLPLHVFSNTRYQPVFDGERNEFGMILNSLE